MSEFQPENIKPTSNEASGGPAPYQGLPDLQGQPFDPRQAYGQQPPAYGQAAPPAPAYGQAAPMSAPAYGQVAPPAPAYGQVAPPAPAYGQAAPPAPAYGQAAPPAPAYGQTPPSGQPYGLPAPMAAPPQNPAWGAPPPNWNSAPAKKRKAWPWVVGGIGALVALGGIGTLVAVGVFGALNADQNKNYTAAPIAAGDVPTIGDKIFVSDDGALAFEMGSKWVDASSFTDVSSISGSLPEGASVMAAYFTFDPTLAVDTPPSFVVVIEGASSTQVGPINVTSMHTDFMTGELNSLKGTAQAVESTGPDAVTTANGLDGLVSTISCEYKGTPVRTYVYTFARGKRVAFVEVFSYTDTYDDATAALVTDSLRIDK